MQSDPIGILAGFNTYGYAGGNPVTRVDPMGLDIAIIENGPTDGNPIGHSAAAITGKGVFSYGNNTAAGSSLSDYLSREAPRRNTRVYIIPSTPAEDAAALAYFNSFLNTNLPGDNTSVFLTDNCSVRTHGGMDAAGIPSPPFLVSPLSGGVTPPYYSNMPGSAGLRAGYAGAEVVSIPQDSTEFPSNLQQFEPE